MLRKFFDFRKFLILLYHYWIQEIKKYNGEYIFKAKCESWNGTMVNRFVDITRAHTKVANQIVREMFIDLPYINIYIYFFGGGGGVHWLIISNDPPKVNKIMYRVTAFTFT